MKRLVTCLLAAVLMLLPTGCGAAKAQESADALHIFYKVDATDVRGGDIIEAVPVDWAPYQDLSTEEQIAALIRQLGRDPKQGVFSPLPYGTVLKDCYVSHGTVWVDFSSPYGQLSGIDLTIADYCVALSLTQLSGIYAARITVDGQELAYRDTQVFTVGDVLLASTEDIIRTLRVRLYFPDESGQLCEERRTLTLYEGQGQLDVLLQALLQGPEQEGLLPLLPTEFEVLGVRLEENICYLNLPSSVVSLLPEEAAQQELLVRGLVRSLGSIGGVEQVQILLDGELRPQLGQIDIREPLTP